VNTYKEGMRCTAIAYKSNCEGYHQQGKNRIISFRLAKNVGYAKEPSTNPAAKEEKESVINERVDERRPTLQKNT